MNKNTVLDHRFNGEHQKANFYRFLTGSFSGLLTTLVNKVIINAE